MPIYQMQTSRLPTSVLHDIDKITRRYVLGGHEQCRGIHLIDWQRITKPVEMGGVGLKQAGLINTALWAKLGCRLLREPDAL